MRKQSSRGKSEGGQGPPFAFNQSNIQTISRFEYLQQSVKNAFLTDCCFYLFRQRQSIVTSWPREQTISGAKYPGATPVVTPLSTAQCAAGA